METTNRIIADGPLDKSKLITGEKKIKQVDRPKEPGNWSCFGRTARLVFRRHLNKMRKAQRKSIRKQYRDSIARARERSDQLARFKAMNPLITQAEYLAPMVRPQRKIP